MDRERGSVKSCEKIRRTGKRTDHILFLSPMVQRRRLLRGVEFLRGTFIQQRHSAIAALRISIYPRPT